MAKKGKPKREYKVGGRMKIEGINYKVRSTHTKISVAKKEMKKHKDDNTNSRVIRRHYSVGGKKKQDYWVVTAPRKKRK